LLVKQHGHRHIGSKAQRFGAICCFRGEGGWLSRQLVNGYTFNNDLNITIDGHKYTDFFTNFKTQYSQNGVFDIVLNDTTVYVDDIQGYNRTALHIDEHKAGQTIPTVRFLQFRDGQDRVTDRFAEPQDGVMYLACGIHDVIDAKGYIASWKKPSSIQVSYSPFGKDDWTSLEMSEMSDYGYYNYGYTYTTSLAGVDRKSTNAWFDVKIKLEDASGNWQEQVISPAFYIASCTGVNEIGLDVEGSGVYNVYDIAGRLIAGNVTDTSNLPRGLYIVKDVNSNQATKVVVR